MLRIFAWAAIALLIGLTSPPKAFAADWAELEAKLRSVVASDEFVEAALDHYKFQGPARTAMRTHLVELYRSEEVIKALLTELRNTGVEARPDLYGSGAYKFGRQFGAELIQSWAMKGMARLPASDQREYFRYVLHWMTVATPADCKQMMYSEGKSALDGGRLESKYFARIPQGELESYLALVRKAIFAQLRDFPVEKTLNGEQLKIAEMAFAASLEQTFRSENVGMEVLTAMADLKSAAPQTACEAGKLIFKALLNTQGLAGDWVLLKMVLTSQ